MAISTRLRTSATMLAAVQPVKPSDGRLTESQVSYIIDTLRSIVDLVNGRVSFGDGVNSSQSGHIDGQTKEVTFTSANTDYEVPHGLGRVPIGVVVLDVNVDGAVVRGGSQGSWSITRLFVRCNQAGATARFIVV